LIRGITYVNADFGVFTDKLCAGEVKRINLIFTGARSHLKKKGDTIRYSVLAVVLGKGGILTSQPWINDIFMVH